MKFMMLSKARNSLFLVFPFLVILMGCQPAIENRNSSGTTIVCFGDSLTAGYGAHKGNDYPSLLAQKVSLPVINAGISGNTTKDGLNRLDSDVLTKNPKMVIITLGANDFFHQVPKEETLSNMSKIVERIQASGAMVVLAAVQTGIFGDAYIDGFKKMAQEKHFLLIPNILKDIMDNPAYKSDQIHPNDEGYKIMADRIYRHIKGLLE